MYFIFGIPVIIIEFIIFFLVVGFSSGIIPALIGFGTTVMFTLLFLGALVSIITEKRYTKVFQLLISGAYLVWFFGIIFSDCTGKQIVQYETSSECPITDVVEGYSYNELPLAEASKNIKWETFDAGELLQSDGSKSTITRRAYGCYKYLYLVSDHEDFEILVDGVEVYGEKIASTLGAQATYKFDIANGDYIQVKNINEENLRLWHMRLYNQDIDIDQYNEDTRLRRKW